MKLVTELEMCWELVISKGQSWETEKEPPEIVLGMSSLAETPVEMVVLQPLEKDLLSLEKELPSVGEEEPLD